MQDDLECCNEVKVDVMQREANSWRSNGTRKGANLLGTVLKAESEF